MSILKSLTKHKPKQINLMKEIKKEDFIKKEDYIITETGNAKQETEYEIVEKEILPEKMICPDCGGITLVGLEYCDKCGGELLNIDNF